MANCLFPADVGRPIAMRILKDYDTRTFFSVGAYRLNPGQHVFLCWKALWAIYLVLSKETGETCPMFSKYFCEHCLHFSGLDLWFAWFWGLEGNLFSEAMEVHVMGNVRTRKSLNFF